MSTATPSQQLAAIRERGRKANRVQDTIKQLSRVWLAENHPHTYQRIKDRARQMVELESR